MEITTGNTTDAIARQTAAAKGRRIQELGQEPQPEFTKAFREAVSTDPEGEESEKGSSD